MSNPNPASNASLLQIPLSIIQQAIDESRLRGSDVASFIMQDGACLGAATTTAPKDADTVFHVVTAEYATSRVITCELTAENIYNIVAMHSPISAIEVGDMLNLHREDTTSRGKVWNNIAALVKRKSISKVPNTSKYAVSGAFLVAKEPKLEIVVPKVRKQSRMRTTEANVMNILRHKGPLTTTQICDYMRIERSESSVRDRVSNILRHKLAPAGKVLVEEKAGGKSIYKLAANLIVNR